MKPLIFIFALFPSMLLAQKPSQPILHAFIFANTNDERIGKSCMVDVINMESEARLISDAIGYKLDLQNFQGIRFDTSNLYNLQNHSRISSKDIVILYFSSHGARSQGDTSEFPDLVFPERDPVFVNSESVHKAFKLRYHPKLFITIIDACNSFCPLSQSQDFFFKGSYTHKFPPNLHLNQVHFYKRLFRDSQGDIILCSSQKGQTSLGDPIEGGVLTNQLISSWEKLSELSETIEIDPITWDRFLQYTKPEVKAKCLILSARFEDTASRYPVWKNNTSTADYQLYDLKFSELSILVMKKTECCWAALEPNDNTYKKLLFGIQESGCIIEATALKLKSASYYVYNRKTEKDTILNGKAEDFFYVTYEITDPFCVYAKVEFKNGQKREIAIIQ